MEAATRRYYDTRRDHAYDLRAAMADGESFEKYINGLKPRR